MLWRCSVCQTKVLGRHMVCLSCGHPKGSSEPYEMPADTASAPSVTDPELLQKAKAGRNWNCAYCGSDQRRLDGSCVQCGAHPASPVMPKQRIPVPRETTDEALDVPESRFHRPTFIVGGVLVAVVSLVLWINRTRTYDAEVEHVRWEQTITVERYRVFGHEGWRNEIPPDAFEVRSLGDRVHHYDRVPDGYDTEHYTVDVACGEDCRPVPERCSEICTSNDNGFATCREVCSGGGQSCTTRYCSEPRTRQVPRYRQEPRYAEFARYKRWEWGVDRTVTARGTSTTDLRWPVEEARVGEGLSDGEQEREARSSFYGVTLRYDGDETIEFAVDSFNGFEIGSRHVLTVAWGTYTVDGLTVRPTQGP